MHLLFEYFFIFFQILIISIFISGCGFLLKKVIFKIDQKESFEDNGLWGFLLISFISLLVNFFLPLSIYINTVIFITISLMIVRFNFFNQSKKKLFKYSFLVSLLSFVLILHSNVNMPDAHLYHLPYSKLINESKILIGSVNLHHRFAHISIFQYVSSFFYNVFFNKNGLLIPISLLTSFFLIYLYKEYKLLFKSLTQRVNSIIVFLILIISIYSFNRYSNFGNDAQAHIYYFLLIVYLFKDNFNYKDNILIKKIYILSIFTFLLKPFYIFTLIIPLSFFLINGNYKYFFKSLSFLFAFIFSFMWFLKNLLVSGCLVYPVTFTCFKIFSWTTLKNIEKQNLLGEAMSKSWQYRIDKTIIMQDYVDNFEWLNTWYSVHLNIVAEKLIPVLIFIFLMIVFFYFFNLLKINEQKKINIVVWLFLIASFLGSLVWFLKFPTYRYGYSYLYSFLIIVLYIFIFSKLNAIKLASCKKYLHILMIISFFGLTFKNLNRISKKIDDPILPNMFDNTIYKNKSKKIFNDDGIFTHFIMKDGSLCGYTSSPCTNRNPEIKVKNVKGYTVYYNPF